LVVTYKVDTTGDIPFTNGFVERSQSRKGIREVRDVTDIPVIDRSTAIIVETNAKDEPPLSTLISPRAYEQVKSFAYPYLISHRVPSQFDAAQTAGPCMYIPTATRSSALSINFVGDHADGVPDGNRDGFSDGDFDD
jgi:hypothetical protein